MKATKVRFGRSSSLWLPLLLAIAGLAGSLVLSHALSLRERQQVRETLQAQAADLRNAIVGRMRLRVQPLATLQRQWEEEGLPSRQRWELDAALAYDDATSREIDLVDPSLQVRWVMPHTPLPTLDLAGNILLREVFARAREQHLIAASRPIELPEGGKAILICLPLYHGEDFDGFIVGSFRCDQLLGSIFPEQIAPAYSIRVFDGAEEIFYRPLRDVQSDREWSQEALAEPYGMEWRVVARPSVALIASLRSRLPSVVFVGGLLMTFLLSLSAYFAGEARMRASQLAVSNRELARSNADLEQFAYAASHDLKEPLHLIANCGQGLVQECTGKISRDADVLLRYSMDAVEQMERLLGDLLAYARVGSGGEPPAAVSAEDALRRALANLRSAIEESQAVVSHDPLPEVLVDHSQLVQVFQNLIANSLKFRSRARPQVHVSAVSTGRECLFSVRDNGIGIDPKHAQRVFVIFQRLHTRGEYPGTGLGLALCKKIVERAGGRIWVESTSGQGADFRFTLFSGKQ